MEQKNDAKKYTSMLRKEFKETYGDLAEKVRKAPDKEAEELSRRLILKSQTFRLIFLILRLKRENG